MIKNAVIAGHDGNIWASSSGFNVTAAELKVILDRYSSTDQLAMNGVTVGGTKYMFLSANDRVVRARKGQSGVHCIKTVQGTSSTSKSRNESKSWVEHQKGNCMRPNLALLP